MKVIFKILYIGLFKNLGGDVECLDDDDELIDLI